MNKSKKRDIRHLRKRGAPKQWGSILGRIPRSSPSLTRAYQLTQRASRVGFDWPNMEGVLDKLNEEIGELREALFLQDMRKIREEIGDLLFIMANVSRFLGIHPEEALKESLDKFISRFHYVEKSLHRQGKPFSQSNLSEMERLWQESKRKEKR